MREIMLVIHLLGLSMGLGTSFGFMFLGIAASKMDKEEAQKFTLNTFALSKMGTIGIILLVISGGYMITPYLKVLGTMPFLIVKLILVLILIALIILLNRSSKKAKAGDFKNQLKRIQMLGRFSLLTAILIVIMAVLSFH